MRFILIILFSICSNSFSFSQDIKVYVVDKFFEEYYVKSPENSYYLNNSTEENKIISPIEEITDPDGFVYLMIEGKKNLFVTHYPLREINPIIQSEKKTKLPYSNYWKAFINSSSFLKESVNGNQVLYSPDNLNYRFLKEAESYSIWNEDSLPWVEGVADNGIGETITLEFKNEVNCIEILNGYINFSKKYLYKQNSRIKTATLTLNDDPNMSILVNFNDKVEFKRIDLPILCKKIELKINEVFEGTKYKDTAISAFFGFKSIDNEEIDLKKIKIKIQ